MNAPRRLGRLVGGLTLVFATAAAPTVLMASGASAAPKERTSPCERATAATSGSATPLVNGRTLAGFTWTTTGAMSLSVSFHDAAGKVLPLQRFSCIGATRIGMSDAPAESMKGKAKGAGLMPIYAVIKGNVSAGAYVKINILDAKGKVLTSVDYPLFVS